MIFAANESLLKDVTAWICKNICEKGIPFMKTRKKNS
jgi:hypothetical protein